MSKRYEYVLVFTRVDSILFSPLEPHPGRAETSVNMHQTITLPPFPLVILFIGNILYYLLISDLPSLTHLIYVFLGSPQQHAPPLMDHGMTARLKQQNGTF